MKELEPNWRIAYTIIWHHAIVMNRTTLSIIALAALVICVIAKCFGYPMQMVFDTFWSFKRIVISIVLFIHFIPVNIYALLKLLRNQSFTKFRLVLVEHEQPPLSW